MDPLEILLEKKLTEALTSLLLDPFGISEESYNLLLDAGLVPNNIRYHVDATDGRFYLPESFDPTITE